MVSRFVYGTRATVPDYILKGGNVYRVISDHLGSVRLVVDTATGTVAQRIDYDEFGRITNNTAPGFQPFGFAGGIQDDSTGLVRFGVRDYDPAVGRWTAQDPVEFAGGQSNLYVYVDSDPINLADPTGLWSIDDFVNASAGFGDVLLFGLGDNARRWLGIGGVDESSGAYRGGSIAGAVSSIVVGGLRLAYAGAAKLVPSIARGATVLEQAESASAMRNTLKIIFRLGLDRTSRIYSFAELLDKYGSAATILAKSAVTDLGFNITGLVGLLRGVQVLLCPDLL